MTAAAGAVACARPLKRGRTDAPEDAEHTSPGHRRHRHLMGLDEYKGQQQQEDGGHPILQRREHAGSSKAWTAEALRYTENPLTAAVARAIPPVWRSGAYR